MLITTYRLPRASKHFSEHSTSMVFSSTTHPWGATDGSWSITCPHHAPRTKGSLGCVNTRSTALHSCPIPSPCPQSATSTSGEFRKLSQKPENETTNSAWKRHLFSMKATEAWVSALVKFKGLAVLVTISCQVRKEEGGVNEALSQ